MKHVSMTVLACVAMAVGCSDNPKDTLDNAKSNAQKAAQNAKKAAEEGLGTVTEKAQAALKDVEGGNKILDKVKELFASATTVLGAVKDKATAETAATKLGELETSADSIGEMTSKLPEGAKTAVGNVIGNGLASLKTLAQKVTAMPGVSDVIKPKLDALMAKLSALTGK